MKIDLPMLYAFQAPIVPFTPFAVAQKVRVFYGLIPHEGIVYSMDWKHLMPDWKITIAHLSKEGGGVCLSSLEQFADGNKVHIIGGWANAPGQQAAIIENIDSALQWQVMNGGIPYHFHDQNCQHFTSWAYGEKPKSESLDAAKAFTVAVGLALFLGNLDN
jgi:hypothetical protein